MATSAPFGLISCDTRTSAPCNFKVNESYQINPAYPCPIYTNDVVCLVGGYIALYTADKRTNGVPPLGVFRGCNYDQVNVSGYSVPFESAWLGGGNVAPGSPVYAKIEEDVTLTFKCQSDQALGVQVTSTGQNAQLNIPATEAAQIVPNLNPSLTSQTSVGASAAANPTYDVKIVGVFSGANGGAYNANPTFNQWTVPGGTVCPYPILLIQFNNSLTRAGTPGAA